MADNSKKILITGAAGLIGREVRAQLEAKGYAVTSIDNNSRFPNYLPNDLIRSNLTEYLNSKVNTFDYVYHMAAINGTTSFYKKPSQVMSNNISADFAVFRFVESNPNTKLVYASSSEVVAGTDIFPTPEITDIAITNIHNPRWSYRLPKVVAENYLANSDINYKIIRFFNVYSEHSGAGHFLKDIVEKLKNKNYELQSPDETRSFCYVRDAVEAMIAIAEQPANKIVNIGSDEEITILEAANIIAAALDLTVKWNTTPSLEGSSKRRRPDISRLLSLYPAFNPETFKSVIDRIKDKL
jgi:nucleoside-diphosphate-sugar epimerase